MARELLHKIRQTEGGRTEDWTPETFIERFTDLEYKSRIDAIDILGQLDNLTVENSDLVVDIMSDIVGSNIPQPISERRMDMIRQQGFPFLSNGAEGFKTGLVGVQTE